MTVYAVVPVKNLKASKRRLSAIFSPQERQQLTIAMLEDVLAALKTSSVDEVVVVGENEQVQQIANCHASSYLPTTRAELNSATEEAISWSAGRGATSILILPADLPHVTAKDINRVLELGCAERTVVLSPSNNWGTNAFYQSEPKLVPLCFGQKSFFIHIREAYDRAVSVRLYFSAGISEDVDSADDLKKLFEKENQTFSKRALENIFQNSEKVRSFFSQKGTL